MEPNNWVGLLCSGDVSVADWIYDATAFVCKISFVQLTVLVAVSESVDNSTNFRSLLKTGATEYLSITSENNCILMLIHEESTFVNAWNHCCNTGCQNHLLDLKDTLHQGSASCGAVLHCLTRRDDLTSVSHVGSSDNRKLQHCGCRTVWTCWRAFHPWRFNL